MEFTEQLELIVKVDNNYKAEMLSKILTDLDFVSSVEIVSKVSAENLTTNNEQDFFALAGLWENRDYTADSLRQAAWGEDVE
jgi:hypothetical protein